MKTKPTIIISEAPANKLQAKMLFSPYVNYDDCTEVEGIIDKKVLEQLNEHGGGIMCVPHDVNVLVSILSQLELSQVSWIFFNPVMDVVDWRSQLTGQIPGNWKMILGHDSLTSIQFDHS